GRTGYSIPAPEAVEAELEAGVRIGARLILWGEAAYPEALAAVDPPPPLLWTLGDPSLMQRPCMAIVGAR
ncbi:MAG TPA: DNA-protecting protein DprA, partial [Brevundimonas sp.]|nr:DNA-protecting protein DprA [Brevundimonas sp.]